MYILIFLILYINDTNIHYFEANAMVDDFADIETDHHLVVGLCYHHHVGYILGSINYWQMQDRLLSLVLEKQSIHEEQ